MDGLTLPRIDGASNENSFYSSSGVRKANASPKSGLEQRLDNLNAIQFPVVDGEASVKSRLITLEATVAAQDEYNKQEGNTLLALTRSLNDVDTNIKTLILSMQSDFDMRLLAMKKEYDHRFDLQGSENKRLQTHVTTLKADTNQLKRKLQSTLDKVRKLQREFGDVEDVEEEDSPITFSPNASSMEFLTRPSTTER